MSWNYRLIQSSDMLGDHFAIHEVYYDDDGKPCQVTDEPQVESEDSIFAMKATLRRMLEACDKPALMWPDDFPGAVPPSSTMDSVPKTE